MTSHPAMTASGLRSLVCLALVVLGNSIAAAQTSESTTGQADVTAEEIQTRLTEIEADTNLDADTKAKAAERLRSALRELTRLKDAAAAEVQYKQDVASAAERAARHKADLEQATRPAESVDFAFHSLAELDAERANREAKIAVLKQRLQEIDTLRKQQNARRAEILRLQAEAEARRAELRQEVDAAQASDEPPVLAEARRLEARLKLKAFEQSATSNAFELAKYSAEETVNLLTLEENLKRAQLAREEAAAEALTRETNKRRRSETEKQIREAEQQKLLTHPLLQDEAEQNRLYAEEISELSTRIEGVVRKTEQTRERLERQQAKFADVRSKEEDIGLTRPIGLMLREQRSQLPDLRELDRQLEGREQLIEEARLASWDYADKLADQPNAPSLIASITSEVALPDDQRLELERMADELLQTRQGLLTELESTSRRYFNALNELDVVERRYIQSSRDDLRYINERILWIRSADPLSFDLVTNDVENWRWMFSRESWTLIGSAIAADPLEHPVAFWPGLLAILALFYFRLRIRPQLRELGGDAGKRGFLRYGPTAEAAALTALSAATVPAALLFVSWRLEAVSDPTRFSQAVSLSLSACAAALFPLDLLRESCRHLGLAEAHFNWPPRSVTHLRHVLAGVKTIGLPFVFLTVLAREYQPLSGGTTAERLLFIGGMLLAAFAVHRLLSARGELAKASVVENPNSLFTRFRTGWHALGLAVPLGLAFLSALGHHYTALQIAERLLWTVWIAVWAVLLRAMAIRWIVLSRRRLLLDQAYQRRAAAAAEEAQDSSGSAPKPPVIEETDVAKSTAQTRKLANIVVLGLAAMVFAMIWADMMTAFGLLDRELWVAETGTGSTAASATDGDGTPAAVPSDSSTRFESITTGDLSVAILLAIFTFLASRNLPGLMEMSVLNRLPVDNATRYAATRLASYAIVIVGVLMASNKLGLRWQNVQWLAAALTVGLGFGLQEVFANFVSGLIILFERPVRVGDIVTIDNVDGVVSRIRMRATTITNWDRKEFIVPNKEFITGRVLNWTLSDTTNRITITVGIGYRSDTELARQILLRICDEHPLLLKEPAPMATFESLGDSTLNLVLRCYLPNLDSRLDVIHSLHTQIVQQFSKAGIEIPYPQRDLNIRSGSGLTLPAPQTTTTADSKQVNVERAAG